MSDIDVGPFADWLGLEFKNSSPDEVVAVWSVETRLHQPAGIAHGGVYCGVVETLASLGARLWFGGRGRVVGVSNSTDFFRAVSDGQLTSVARPLHRGRSQQVWTVETTDNAGRLVSRGQVRFQNLTSPQ